MSKVFREQAIMRDASMFFNRPTRRPWLLLSETIVGAATGVLLAFGGGYLGPVLTQGIANGWNDLAASVIGALVGYVIGAPLGVIVSARLLKQRGVPWRSVLGSVLGGLLILLLAEPLRLNQYSWLLMLTFASVALIGALVGFQKKLRMS